MPIKFRCNYCRQFLGISRAQAGGVVDCPTCGRSIRVPLLDGTVQPMSSPELDLDDAHLNRALDELARLVAAPVQQILTQTPSSQLETEEGETENLIPQALPEPIPIEVPLPPTPVVITPAIDASLETSTDNSIVGEHGLLAELAAMSAGMPAAHPAKTDSATIQPTDVQHSARLSPQLVSLFSIILFVAGMLTERFVRFFEGFPRTGEVSSIEPAKKIVDNELTGRITFKKKEGESQADRGATILVFPQHRPGEVKLSVVGFRPADLLADQLVADAALKALGGGAATADDRGVFRLPIEAGSYRILVLSHFQSKQVSTPDTELEKLLSNYFENPESLLGRVEHKFASLRIRGTDDLWDHSF